MQIIQRIKASAIKRPVNVDSITPHKVFLEEQKFSDNLVQNFPLELLASIYKYFDNYSLANVLGRTSKIMYQLFLENYKLQKFEAVPLKTVENTLFFVLKTILLKLLLKS